MSRDEVEAEDPRSAASPWSISKQRGPERQRSLAAWVFGASLAVHASAAFGLHARASERSSRPLQEQIEIELAPPPPSPPPAPPEPEPAPEPQQAPPPKQPKAQPRPQVAKPRPSHDAPPPEASSNLPSSAEGTLPPAPPGPVNTPLPPPPPPAPPPPAPVVEAKEGANYLKNPRPAYPRLALREGWEGKVVLRVKVLPDGKVGGATVQRSAGRTVLDEAALEIVKTWTFVPASQGGKPIAGFVSVPFEFKIN